MRRKRHTEPQIVFALQQAESGTAVAEVCRRMGVLEQTFYRWKRRLRQMEDENRRLRQLVADLTLDKAMLQEVRRNKA